MSVRVRVTGTGQAGWQGDLAEGGGRIGVGSGAHERPFTLRLERLAAGFAITNIPLETVGDVPGVDAETFSRRSRTRTSGSSRRCTSRRYRC